MPCSIARGYKRAPYFTQQLLQSPLALTNMDISFDSNMSRMGVEEAFHPANGIQERSVLCTCAAVALAAVLLTISEAGHKAFRRIAWFIDGMLGGAPHSVTLPGPPGLPLVGNLTHVSCLSVPDLDSSDRYSQMQTGHIQKIAQWTKKYGDVIRVSLGEREAVCFPL